MIGLRSFVNGASLQSYNEFVGLRSGVNFIIPWDSFIASASRSALQVNGKLLYIANNFRRS